MPRLSFDFFLLLFFLKNSLLSLSLGDSLARALCRLRSAVNDHPPKTPKLLKERKKGEKKTRTEVLRVSNPNFAKEEGSEEGWNAISSSRFYILKTDALLNVNIKTL